jgi:hypothetical protein
MCGPTGSLLRCPAWSLSIALATEAASNSGTRVGARRGQAPAPPACAHLLVALPIRAGSTFCLGLSIFAVLFLSVLATLINKGYPYAGVPHRPLLAASLVQYGLAGPRAAWCRLCYPLLGLC